MAAVLQGVEEPFATKLAKLGVSAEQGCVPQSMSCRVRNRLVLSSCYDVATLLANCSSMSADCCLMS
jgi:hypothetical protein